MDNPERLLRRREVEGLIGLKRSKLYQMIHEGMFPAPVKLTERAVAWRAPDVSAWLTRGRVSHARKQKRPQRR